MRESQLSPTRCANRMADDNLWKIIVTSSSAPTSEVGEPSSGADNYLLESNCIIDQHDQPPASLPTMSVTTPESFAGSRQLYGDLRDIIQPALATPQEQSIGPTLGLDIGQSTGTGMKGLPRPKVLPSYQVPKKPDEPLPEKNPNDNRPKGKPPPNAANERHNLFERRRRAKINERINTLKEMVPNCNKTGSASVLNDTINYAVALKQQLEYMSAMRGATMQQQAGFMPPPAAGMIQSAQPDPHQFFNQLNLGINRPDLWMGMAGGAGYGTFFPAGAGHPVTYIYAPPVIGMPQPYVPRNLALPQHAMMPGVPPYNQLPAPYVDPSVAAPMLPNLATGLPPRPAIGFPTHAPRLAIGFPSQAPESGSPATTISADRHPHHQGEDPQQHHPQDH